MPFRKFERSLSGSPASSISGMRFMTSSKITRISSRARFAPRQKCSPLPKAMCSLGFRPTSNWLPFTNLSSSRFADGYQRHTSSPSLIFTPDLCVLRRYALEMHDRRRPAHDLLDRVVHEGRIIDQPLTLRGILHQREHAARRRVPRRLVPRQDQQQEEQEDLAVVEALPIEF